MSQGHTFPSQCCVSRESCVVSSRVHYSTTQHNTTQHNRRRDNTAQHSIRRIRKLGCSIRNRHSDRSEVGDKGTGRLCGNPSHKHGNISQDYLTPLATSPGRVIVWLGNLLLAPTDRSAGSSQSELSEQPS
ncbi:unnamed protein product [Protopolystoma xenopodis]|uniref:Uncharacterized protein n=1 Tax=Protopolystoma xenopodis TaxID=117903 RepID=A0A448WBL6_9PLAT|nr:unnamed protein product [Protopolystoma xenopodis]